MGLYQAFHRSAESHTDRPALVVDDQTLSYDQLRRRALAVARSLGEGEEPFAAVLASRSVACFSGILGVLASGRGYVPMLPSLPPARLATMLNRSEAQFVVVDAAGRETFEQVEPLLEREVTVIVADECTGSVAEPPGLAARADDLAYLLFTLRQHGHAQGGDGQPGQHRPLLGRGRRPVRPPARGSLQPPLRDHLRPVAVRHVRGLACGRLPVRARQPRADAPAQVRRTLWHHGVVFGALGRAAHEAHALARAWRAAEPSPGPVLRGGAARGRGAGVWGGRAPCRAREHLRPDGAHTGVHPLSHRRANGGPGRKRRGPHR